MKKKIFFVICVMLVATNAFATIVTKNITATPKPDLAAAKEGVSSQWQIMKPADVVYINNQSPSSTQVFLTVTPVVGLQGFPVNSDPTTVICGDGKSVTLMQYSSVVCNVPAGTKVQVQVKQEDFKNGSGGSYGVLN